jgi:hypothetical protein
LADQGYGTRTVWRRVRLVLAFGEFAHQRGVAELADLPAHVDAYVTERLRSYRGRRKNGTTAQQVTKEVRGPIEQMLRLVVPGSRALAVAIATTHLLKRCRDFSSTWSWIVGCGRHR